MEQHRPSVRLLVRPPRALFDEKLTIQVKNARPGAKLTLHAFYINNENIKWESFAHFVADSSGVINLLEDPSLGGTYSGVRPMGLMESLRSDRKGDFYRFNEQLLVEVTVSVYPGHLTEGFTEEGRLACVPVERCFKAPGVRQIPINEPHLTAALFLPPGPGPFPGVLDLWGGVSVLMTHRAALLASHGFAVMALNYTFPDIAVKSGGFVDDAYFETAYTALRDHPQVNSDRIAMLGFCTGATMTLKMTAYSEVMKLSCAVSVCGTHHAGVKNTLQTFVENSIKYGHKIYLNEREEMVIQHIYLLFNEPEHKLDMGRLQCPLLCIAAEDDQHCPSYVSALEMKDIIEEAGKSHLLTTLAYPKAGHIIDVAYMPHYSGSRLKPLHWKKHALAAWGGELEPHCLAQEDSWRKILSFLRSHLYC